jgi:hypothetical protein
MQAAYAVTGYALVLQKPDWPHEFLSVQDGDQTKLSKIYVNP